MTKNKVKFRFGSAMESGKLLYKCLIYGEVNHIEFVITGKCWQNNGESLALTYIDKGTEVGSKGHNRGFCEYS